MIGCQVIVLEHAIHRQQFSNLRVYSGAEHPHEAQNPQTLDIAALSRKNVRVAKV